jgi:hypothetical protein
MRTKPPFFDPVRTASASRWDQIEQDQEFGSVWRLMFNQVQNPRHVLSELLQNADDAGATEASVTVENGCFLLCHNGHDFTPDEFASLCRFGFSNKRRLLTIGFRGIGFKSVFSLGATVAVVTPTLAFRFDRKRFTQPEWLDTEVAADGTVIWVQIESPEKQAAIQTQIDSWTRSAVPLLFFQSIRTLRLRDREIRVEPVGPGPCGNSEEVKLSGLDGTAIVFRSEALPLPVACLEEIRTERNEEIDLPPCEVVIILGAGDRPRLYCVLPTEVTVELPCSCHAPFVQDPARTGIKEPSISPTNAWLLDRIGKLAADSLLTWLGRTDLPAQERAKAYRLLPELTPLNIALLSGAASQRVLDSFRERMNYEKAVLCEGGHLDSRNYVGRLPSAAIEAWGVETARTLFSPNKRSVLSKEVPGPSRSRLEAWQHLEPAAFGSLFDVLGDESRPLPPRPARIEALAELWAFLHQHLPTQLMWVDWWAKAAIVPLAGRGHLARAKDTLASRARPAECPAADWQFVAERAEILDEDWRDLMDLIKDDPQGARRRFEDTIGRRPTDKDLGGILEVFRKTKLDETPRLDHVFAHVAARVFTAAPEAAEAVKLIQLAAKLNVSFAEAVPIKFLCIDGQWRRRSDGLVVEGELDLARLLPARWVARHLVSPEYEKCLSPSEIIQWRRWAVNPEKCGLAAFALPVKAESSRSWLNPEFFRARGAQVPSVGAKAKKFSITDWDWEPDLWDHWRRLEHPSETSIWTEIGWAVTRSWSKLLDARAKVKIQEHSYKYVYAVSVDVPAAWLHELRNRPCVLDTRGKARMPAGLLRRTVDTLPLLDVEDFVHDRWDSQESQQALDSFGVSRQATDASKLLDRIRALSQAAEPPMGPLRDLYRAIEKVLPRLPANREKAVVDAFANERLIRTEADWERSGFSFRDNPGGIPGVSVLHPEVRDVIGLWEKLVIAPRPTAADALKWFASLPCDASLSDPARNAAKKVLASYPQDAWNSEKRWLNLQGRLATTSEIRWGSLDGRAIPGLFAAIRKETADFSMLDSTRIHSLAATVPRLLENTMKREIVGYVPSKRFSGNEQAWLQSLGQVLAKVNGGDASESVKQADQQSGARLARTAWVPAEAVRVRPFLDGTPAGAEAELPIAWIGECFYVRGDSTRGYKQIVQEISKHFTGQQALATIRDCVGRDPRWIQAYADEYLDLTAKPVPDKPAPPVAETKPPDEEQPSVFPTNGAQEPVPEPPARDTAEEDHAETSSPPDDKKKPDGGRRSTAPKEPSKMDRMGHFLATRGFAWDDETGMFVRPDGSVVRRSDGVFSWELAANGRVNPLWLAATCMTDRNGLEIPAEVWNAAKRCEAVLLEPEGDGCREYPFSAIRTRVETQSLELYAAVYRIRLSNEC